MNQRRRGEMFHAAVAITALLSAGLCLAAQPAALAQSSYPSRAIKLVVGFPAGTSVDTLARLVADKLQPALGQPIVVENVAGAAGNIAADRVSKSEPDGHTLLMAGNAVIVINQSVYEKLPYDPIKDFLPISQIAVTPNVLVVHPGLAATTTQELVALARSQPDGLTYAHAGIGISQHLAGELFNKMAGIATRPVAYRGGNMMFPDLVAGRVNFCFCSIVTSMPLVREGKLRALAVTSLQRWPSVAELPTMVESGFPGFDATAWFGLMAPAGTPASIIDRLHRETVGALAAPDLRKTLDELGMGAIGNSPAEFTAAIRQEVPYWQKIIKEIGLKQQ